jgi:hypothetical protein
MSLPLPSEKSLAESCDTHMVAHIRISRNPVMYKDNIAYLRLVPESDTAIFLMNLICMYLDVTFRSKWYTKAVMRGNKILIKTEPVIKIKLAPS